MLYVVLHPLTHVCSLNRKLSMLNRDRKILGANDAHSYRCRLASTLAVSSLSHAAEVGSGDTGIRVKNLRSAVRRAICSTAKFNRTSASADARSYATGPAQQPPVNVSELETMHRLVTAEILMKTLCAHRQKKWRMSKLLSG